MTFIKNFDDIEVGQIYELQSYGRDMKLDFHLLVKCDEVKSYTNIVLSDLMDFLEPDEELTDHWGLDLEIASWNILLNKVDNPEVYNI